MYGIIMKYDKWLVCVGCKQLVITYLIRLFQVRNFKIEILLRGWELSHVDLAGSKLRRLLGNNLFGEVLVAPSVILAYRISE